MNADISVTKADLALPSYFHFIFDKVDRYMIQLKVLDLFERANKNHEATAVLIDACVILGHVAFPLDITKLNFAMDQWDWFSKVERRFSEICCIHPSMRIAVKELAQEVKNGRIPHMSESQFNDVLKFEFSIAAYRTNSYPHLQPLATKALLLSVNEGIRFFTPFAKMDMDLKLPPSL